jgi:hypothetical protein
MLIFYYMINKGLKMKKTKVNLAIACALIISSGFTYSNDFRVIVKKSESDYLHKPVSSLPSEEQGVPASVLNETTGDTESGDIMKSSIAVLAENSDSIKITSTVTNRLTGENTITGNWSSNLSLNYIKNDSSGVEFMVPDYDGDIYLTLQITDGLYNESMKPVIIGSTNWQPSSPEYTEWVTTNVVQDWSPSTSTVYENTTLEQTKIINRERTKQEKEERPATGETRNVGDPILETETNHTETQTVQGTMAYWEPTDPYVVQDWTITEIFQDWNPDASTVYENTTVDQSREVKKERIIIDQEIRPATGEIRQVGSQKNDTSVIIEYRTIPGELEYWVNTGEVTCTEWVFDRYEAWTPDASDYDRDQEVAQTRKMYESRQCSGEQYRPATDEYRQANGETEYRESTESRTVYGTKIDLNDWYTNDASTAGDWSVSNDGSYAYQSINGAPTFFESAASTYGNTIIRGKMRVRAGAGDNDWIGMALGKLDTNNFYLWSWKNGANSGSSEKEGHNFAKVTNKSAINWAMDQSKTGYQVLATKHGNYGWNHGNYYNFEIRYTPTNVKIYIEGSKVVDVNGTFPTGQIAFFNYSQGQVEYYKITEEQY